MTPLEEEIVQEAPAVEADAKCEPEREEPVLEPVRIDFISYGTDFDWE